MVIMQKKTVYEFLVLGHKNNGTTENPDWNTEIVVEKQYVLATSPSNAQFQIFRKIPDAQVEKFGSDNLEIFIRPFVKA